VSQFGAIAPFYDELMRTVPYRMWVDYYLLLLAHMNVRPKSVLDVCCGTGTVAEMLAETDIEITGVDVSATMIEVAREKALEKGFPIRYVCADVSEMDLGRKFDGAYSFFDSLNYIAEPERLQSALKRVAAHLPSGATFVFDLNTAYAFEKKMFDQAQLRPHSRLRYEWQGDWDPKSRLISVHMQFWYGDREIKETHVQRAYSDEEIRAMLGEAGFEDVKAYHSYTLEKPRMNSDRVHYTAIKS
jgi:ubiquinone/menaquinone biosynthesis C-methylase UbiE